MAQGHRREIPWRRPIASLNYLLVSPRVAPGPQRRSPIRIPGFIDHVVNKKAEVVRVYLPPDANTLLSVADHCLRSRDYVNVIVAGKQPALTTCRWMRPIDHCTRGLGIWRVGQQRRLGELSPTWCWPAAGDVPTLETLAAADILREHLPELGCGWSTSST